MARDGLNLPGWRCPAAPAERARTVEQVTALLASVMPWDAAMSYATAEFLVVGVRVRAAPHKSPEETSKHLMPPDPPAPNNRSVQRIHPAGPHPYLLGLLAMIKCSICSYQCDNWYTSDWRFHCHNNFSRGGQRFQLAGA